MHLLIKRIFSGILGITFIIFAIIFWVVFIIYLVNAEWRALLIWSIIGGVTWFLRNRSKKSKSSRTVNETVQAVEVTDFRWSDGGNFNFEVVGESFYQKDLKILAGEHKESGCRVYGTAVLVPEDDNPHDNKAVAVYVKTAENQPGRQVGHLSRRDARSFRRRLGAKKLAGQRTLCDAVIVGGRLKKGIRQSYGVWLDMKPFD